MKKILVCLTMALLLMVALCGAAMAENAAVVPEVNVVLSQNRFNGPAPVDVTITVTNKASTDMPGPCALYDPNGARISEFGTPTLTAGQSVVWTGTWQVTEAQLTAGKLTFVLVYDFCGEDGVVVRKQQYYSVSIVDAGAEAKLEVNRTITPTTARNGQKVYVTYTITNVGNADATNVTIKESSAIASSPALVGTVKAGETVTYTFTVTMGKKSIKSNATVTWKYGAGDGSVSVPEATIKYGDVKLTATLSVDKKGGPVGDVVMLTLTLKNTGKSDIGNITVTDPILGTVFSGETVPAGKTVTLEKELTITSTADYIFTVSGTNASGTVIETATEFVHVIAVDPANEVTLMVVAEADRDTIYTKPGIVKFTVHVTNTSAVPATGVTVTATGVKVYPYNTSSSGDTIAPGETITFVRDVRVDYPGTFRFDAHATGQLGETLTFESNSVVIRYAPPTATPTMAPITTPRIPVTQPVPAQDSLPAYYDTAEQALDTGFKVLLGLAGVCLALIVVGIVGRVRANAKSSTAADTISRAQASDYTRSVSDRNRHYMPESDVVEDAPDAPVYDDAPVEPVQPVDVPAAADEDALASSMQDAMTELYPEVPVQEEVPAAEPVAEEDFNAPDASDFSEAPADEDPAGATYRRRRRTSHDE